jgi:hypothetical protein
MFSIHSSFSTFEIIFIVVQLCFLNNSLISKTFSPLLMKDAAINAKLFLIANVISDTSFSVIQGRFSFTHGKFICLLFQTTQPLSAFTFTLFSFFSKTFRFNNQESTIIVFPTFIS